MKRWKIFPESGVGFSRFSVDSRYPVRVCAAFGLIKVIIKICSVFRESIISCVDLGRVPVLLRLHHISDEFNYKNSLIIVFVFKF